MTDQSARAWEIVKKWGYAQFDKPTAKEWLALTDEIAAALTAALKDRDMEWWEAVACVDNVAPTPEACKAWQVALTELAHADGARAQRERDANLADLMRLSTPIGIAAAIRAQATP